MTVGKIVMGLLFFPRGGSAQVTRYLAAALEAAGRPVSLVAGSLGEPGEETHAATFFPGIPLQYLDYTAAVAEFEAGGSAVGAPVPMHPSYEDREDAPDVVLAAVDPGLADHLSSVWEGPFAAAGAADADVFHLHHLTPQLDAAKRRWPHVPIVAHLHGTEIKLIESIEERAEVARLLGHSLATMPTASESAHLSSLSETQLDVFRTTRWSQWRHGQFWLDRLRAQAAVADHLVVVSPPDQATAISVLGLAPERVTAVPNGVDTELFRPQPMTANARRDHFRRWLVDEPQGWDETGVPGSLRYTETDLDRLLGADGETTVLMFVGRFTAAKRVSVLLEGFANARAHSRRPMSLVLWGGHPGEWEGEHPAAVARRVGGGGVFFAGWRGHDDLPVALAACDAVVMPSVNDSYPQAPLEAMATGKPVIATHSGGFPLMVNLDPARPTGWLVAPDDAVALAAALVDAVEHPDEIGRRGDAALAHARAELSWSGRVAGFEAAYAAARARHRAK